MSQSIVSVSNSTLTYQSAETLVGATGDNFTFAKSVRVTASTGSTDQIDLSADARKALEAFLAGDATSLAGQKQGGGSDADSTTSGNSIQVSVASTKASTTGDQSDYATDTQYDLSWTGADGSTGKLEVEEGWSLTTNDQLIPLADPSRADAEAPGVEVSASDVTISEKDGGFAASTTTADASSSRESLDAGKAALLLLKASSSATSWYTRTNDSDTTTAPGIIS